MRPGLPWATVTPRRLASTCIKTENAPAFLWRSAGDGLDGIDAGQIGALVEVAVDVRESEILNVVGAAVLLGDDVLDV